MKTMRNAFVLFLVVMAYNVWASTDQYVQLGFGGGGGGGTSIGDLIIGGTSGSVLFIDSTAKLAQDNAKFYWDDTNYRLGIGTASPAAALDVKGATNLSAAVIRPVTNNSAIGLVVTGTSDNDSAIELNNTTPATGNDWTFRAHHLGKFEFIDSTAGATYMTIATDGKVGIGSGTPGALLDVAGTAKLGSTGTALTAMGVCTISSTTISTTVATQTCTGVPASASVAVSCAGAAAFSTPTAGGLYCRATGSASQVECNTAVPNTQAMTYTCMWVKP